MIIMGYPFAAITKIIELRDPNLMDHRRMETAVAFKMSMTGVLYGKRTTVRPEVLVWTFSDLPRLKAQEFRDFIVASAGQDVRLIDHLGNSWKGRLAVKEFTFRTLERGLGAGVPEYVTVSIEFEGNQL